MTTNKKTVVRKYSDFHGTRPIRVRRVTLPNPKGGKVMKIGRLISLTYEPESPSALKGSHFSHTFGDFGTLKFGKRKPLLVTDGTNLYIVRDGAPYYFDKRGIIG